MEQVATKTVAADKKTAVEIKDLTVRFGEKTVLDNINLKIFEGDFVALIGPNGSGKSTLLKTILGMVQPSCGSVTVYGRPPGNGGVKIGYIPQKLNFEKSLAITVREFLSLGLSETKNWFFKRHRKLDNKFGGILDRFGLNNLLETQVCRLSGGELQKTLIAFSLLNEPDLLLMDEATEGVDMATENIIYEVISGANKARKMTVVMVSHDIAMVSREATHVIAIGNGKVCCEGPPAEVLTDDSLHKAYGIHATPYCHHH